MSMEEPRMYVVNREGKHEPVRFDKVLGRISSLAEGLHVLVDPTKVAQAVINGMYSGISTSELDDLAAQTCAYMAANHPDFSKLAARISVSNLHKNTFDDFAHTARILYEYKDERGADAKLISPEVYEFIRRCADDLNKAIDYSRDFEFDYFAFKTLERSYLLRVNGKIIERPQHLFMRVACGIHYPKKRPAEPKPRKDLTAKNGGGFARILVNEQKDIDPETESLSDLGEEQADITGRIGNDDKNGDGGEGGSTAREDGGAVAEDGGSIARENDEWSEANVRACLSRVIETYDLMSKKYFTHATPTLFNSGTSKAQMSSCFLLQIRDDSISGIFDTLKQCALISKSAGGIGLAIHKIRGTGTYIAGTNGYSNGIIPMLRVFNDTARYVDQGGGKRKGSFAIYLEPWHTDIFEFLDLRKNHGKEEHRARDLFYALWIPDLFMERVKNDQHWTLMCPRLCPGLSECYGEEFNQLYLKYEQQNQPQKRTVKAQQLWFAILQSQIETGNPFMVYKDACNRKSNQKNLGTIQCSNLCTEIVEYTAPDEIAVCNLASLALPRFVTQPDPSTPMEGGTSVAGETMKTLGLHGRRFYGHDGSYYDLDHLYRVTKVVAFNLNKVIDRNHYPVLATKRSNLRHRPIGIGVQGFADVLMLLRFPYESELSSELNKVIFETIYFAAVETSLELAKIEGPYSTFWGSPASQGKLQFDLWNDERKLLAGKRIASGEAMEDEVVEEVKLCGLWDWANLKAEIVQHGIRNSLLIAPMPTASTSQILGNCESFEPYTSNIYTRRVLSGEFFVVNPHLLKDLIKLGLWNDNMKQRLIAANGSIQSIPNIPTELKDIYKAVWEIKQRTLIDLASDRAPFIDQSQSLNLYVTNPTFAKLSSMHFYSWKKGLKTGMYYLRTQSAVDAIKFTVDKATINATNKAQSKQRVIQDSKVDNQMMDKLKGPILSRDLTTTASDENVENARAENVVCQRRPANVADDDVCLVCSG